jgi:transposase
VLHPELYSTDERSIKMSQSVLGIDVSKLKFNVCLITPNQKPRHKVFLNNPDGFELLADWLEKQKAEQFHACLEATGTYGESLALFLLEHGCKVSVVNPAAVRAFAGAGLSRTKTDKVDADLIARFCLSQEPEMWKPPAPQIRELQALVRRLESLIEMRISEENRLSSGITVESVRVSLQQHIKYLIDEIKRTEEQIKKHINNHPDLKRQRDLLDSIPGVGETTAALFLAEIIDFKQYKNARQVAAFAGLVPREKRSGTSIRGKVRLSKIGNARLRKALYFPAITALRCSEYFKQWAEGLRQRGKCKMAVIGAIMRKLIHLAYGVLKTGKPFDPNWGKTA